VIIAGLTSRAVGVGNVKCEETARDRRCICRDFFPGMDGTVVNESGEAGGEVGHGSLAEGICRDGIDSK
jgi:hypothetical protein